MSLTPFEPGDIETFTIQTTPSTTFISNSTGVTGAAYVYSRRSNAVKDYYVNWSAVSGAPTGSFQEINDIDDVLEFAKLSTNTTQFNERIKNYLNIVGLQPQSRKNAMKQEVVRFIPGVNLDLNMTRKFVTTNVLMPTYHLFGTSYNFAYTNYHSLNFLTASGLPTGSALLYPASGSSSGIGSIVSSSYIPSGAFSFDFWINPRYTTDTPSSEFKAGTIFHLSGAYALSLVSGSSRDSNGYINGFRLLLQLSSSAKTIPSTINPSSLSGLNFISSDNCLKKNNWHHVTVRWGTDSYNFGSGSFMVDGEEKGTFYIPSSSIAPLQESGITMPSILTIGNFLECSQSMPSSVYFFSDRAQVRYGVPVSASAFINYSPPYYDEPTGLYALRHPLNAEVHELKIYNKYLGRDEITSRSLSSAPLNDPNLLFYLPPHFTRESPTRTVDTIGGVGGVLVHPFQCIDGTTNQPFNVDLSFDTGGHYINLENWTRDFATGNYPRLIQLTGSAINGNTAQLTANEFLYATGSVRKASLTILPNDNGNFIPSYYNMLSNLNTSSFKTDKGDTSYSLISLRNLYSLESIYDLAGVTSGSGRLNTDNDKSILSTLSGFDSTSSLGTLNPQRTPTILQRTRENGSLQVVIFDISNLFYGDRILPGSFVLTDNNLSNSYGKIGITLKDDGTGNLYRADSEGKIAVNNTVGNIFYDHGLVLIKNPSLYWFGENEFTCSFKGERNIHVMKMDLYANPLELVSSSNPSWKPSLQASDSIDNYDKRYVYITDLLIHDDNLNVIARTKLSQPLLKASGDKYKFVVKIDC